MAAVITDVKLTPQVVDAGKNFVISVGVYFPSLEFAEIEQLSWDVMDTLIWDEVDTNLITDRETLEQHTFSASGATSITDNGTVLEDGVYHVNFTKIAAGDKRLRPGYDLTFDTTKDYLISFELKQIQNFVSIYSGGEIVNNTTYKEKHIMTISAAYVVSPASGVNLIECVELPDGFYRIVARVTAAYFTGTGNTGHLTRVYTNWSGLGNYEYYFRKPQVKQFQ